MKQYLFIGDEKGDPGLIKGASSNLVFGGYVVLEPELTQVIAIWQQFKTDTCGTPDVELKSEHFFASRSKHNPLLIRNRETRRVTAMKGLEIIYDTPSVAPLACCIFKERASKELIVETQSGKRKIDSDTIWVAPFGLFAVFLAHKRAAGQVLWDEVSGNQEHRKKNAEWKALKQARGARPELRRIAEEILFTDSKANEAIQVADFLCGVLWQAMVGDEVYLSQFLSKYNARTRGDGLGIIIIQ